MKERLDIEINKNNSKFLKDARIKECFHYDKENCKEEIIAAHSLQESKVLELLEYNVNGNNKILSFQNFKYSENGIPIALNEVGKGKASTFFGFCRFHDLNIFKPIENNLIDLEKDEHCFLLSYRAFARDFHAKYESNKGMKINKVYQNEIPRSITSQLLSGGEMAYNDGLYVKNRLNDILEKRKFDELEYLTIKLSHTIPIAVAGSITPSFSYSNKLLNRSSNPEILYEYINVIIQPCLEGGTNILLSCLPEHEKSITYIKDIEDLNINKFLYALTSLVIGNIENTFISPRIWIKLTSSEKRLLIDELIYTNPIIREADNKCFRSKLNLFDKRFSIH